MIGNFNDRNEPALKSKLYRYCKDEGLDYQYIVANLNAEHRTIIMRIRKWLLSKGRNMQGF